MDKNEFIKHREKISHLMDDHSLFIIFANKDSENEIEQNRNFYYVTGIKENNDILVIKKEHGKATSTLFIQPFDEFKAKWVGASLSKDEAYNLSGVEDIRYLNQFDIYLQQSLTDKVNLYFDFKRFGLDNYLSELEVYANNLKNKFPFINLRQGRNLFQTARTIKSEEEIKEIKKAISITKKGIENILKNIKPGLYEYQLESYFDQSIKYEGATGYAFNTIAASGENGCCLHYGANKDVMKDKDLILFDLGSSVNMYCSDISRTFPVNGKFTDRQKQIYNIVLEGQKTVFDNIKPGITTKELNNILIKFYQVKLKEIGLIKEDSEVSKYYYHGVSHHIGLDCHDLCDYTPLKAGSIISNEPGLYIKEENIGIRIEDDILVTEDGAINLSEEIIKDPDLIEEFIAKNK